ncbi:MAG TPA: helix-turn-helix domain-containing protein [Mycobacteriales bacterium]|nr:helix-turn-helix domain-containing protein [Mycobacteriales bacterium]
MQRRAPSAAVVRRVERQVGDLTTRARARLDGIAWFAALPADVRSWVGVVVQTGIQGLVAWMREPERGAAAPDATFAAAPRTVARAVSLEQTVELIRVVLEVVEDAVEDLVPAAQVPELRTAVERYAREVAFAAATVYARAAQQRGALDARLQTLVIEALLADSDERVVSSRAAALGELPTGPVMAIAARPTEGGPEHALESIQRVAAKRQRTVVASVHLGVVVGVVPVGNARDPLTVAAAYVDGLGAAVAGPVAPEVREAGASARAALGGLAVVDAWPAAPRPAHADDLLPERVLAGEVEARARLVELCYRPVSNASAALVETIQALLETNGNIEATARSLFVHANTLRYRLSRVSELTGYDPREPRDAFALRLAFTLARL